MKRISFLCSNLILLLFSCVYYGCSNDHKDNSKLNIFAAMSLKDALTEVGNQFTEEYKLKVYYNFAATTTLQRQIEKGGNADVFISASPKHVEELITLNLIENRSKTEILGNNLVIVSQKDSDISLDTIGELSNPKLSRIAIGQPDIVPAGAYAKEVFLNYGMWEKIQPKLIYGLNVRATLAYVSAGNVDLAIVYETDSKINKNIKVVYRIPAKSHSPIVYPAAILTNSERKQNAKQFISFMQTLRAKDIFIKHGFTNLSPNSIPVSDTDISQ